MKRLLIPIFVTIAALAALGFAAVRGTRTDVSKSAAPSAADSARADAATAAAPGTSTAEPQDGSPRVIRFAAHPQPMPPLLTMDLNNQIVSSAAVSGKVVLVNFWATWCPPCREEIPQLIELSKRYKEQLLVIGVSMDDLPPEAVRRFAEEAGINYPIIMYSHEILRQYGGVPGLPTAFVISPQGGVVQKHVGLYPLSTYDNEIRALLGMPVNVSVETFEDHGQIFLKNASELPGVDFAGLSPEQRKAALRRLNSEGCDCGCRLTLAQCRINDTGCPVSVKLAAKVVKQIAAAATP
jgi:thiol-disulfide isomerase/thioredoxin